MTLAQREFLSTLVRYVKEIMFFFINQFMPTLLDMEKLDRGKIQLEMWLLKHVHISLIYGRFTPQLLFFHWYIIGITFVCISSIFKSVISTILWMPAAINFTGPPSSNINFAHYGRRYWYLSDNP